MVCPLEMTIDSIVRGQGLGEGGGMLPEGEREEWVEIAPGLVLLVNASVQNAGRKYPIRQEFPATP